jgi:NAD(P)-dependent dehydrogenase (short-subunit alcohol dehydrogenase family)
MKGMTSMGNLDKKTAIVTGAGRGIGRGIALALAREGANVAIADIVEESAHVVATEIRKIGGKAMAARCDIRSSEQVSEFVTATISQFGGVDVLVNNAMAADVRVPLEDIEDDSIDLAFATGPMATLYFMRACFPHLASNGGRIINLRSGSEIQGLAGYGTYIAAKAAVGGITRAAAREWGRRGITVNAICPFALSEAAKSHFDGRPEDLEAAYASLSIPGSGDPELDIGRAAVFLAGPDASFITGCTLMVDGGGSFLG